MVQFVEDIQENLGLTPQALEREFAVLHHCKLLCRFKKDDVIYFTQSTNIH